MEAHDVELKISIPNDHELAEHVVNGPSHGRRVFRSRAVALLDDIFEGDCPTLKEERTKERLQLKVAVKTQRLEEFRARIAELGFSVDIEVKITIPNSRSAPSAPKVALLREMFDGDLWTIAEERTREALQLKVGVNEKRIDEFRARVVELGFTIDGEKA